MDQIKLPSNPESLPEPAPREPVPQVTQVPKVHPEPISAAASTVGQPPLPEEEVEPTNVEVALETAGATTNAQVASAPISPGDVTSLLNRSSEKTVVNIAEEVAEMFNNAVEQPENGPPPSKEAA